MGNSKPLERDFQRRIVARLRDELGAIVLKNDSSLKQGAPDLTVLLPGGRVALLEVKRKAPTSSDYRPNQEWYLETLRSMRHYAAVIHPGNEEEVLDALR
jgi:hypothetical protein|nr:MAG TPA: Nuclease [Caudoviricetes sp.]